MTNGRATNPIALCTGVIIIRNILQQPASRAMFALAMSHVLSSMRRVLYFAMLCAHITITFANMSLYC